MERNNVKVKVKKTMFGIAAGTKLSVVGETSGAFICEKANGTKVIFPKSTIEIVSQEQSIKDQASIPDKNFFVSRADRAVLAEFAKDAQSGTTGANTKDLVIDYAAEAGCSETVARTRIEALWNAFNDPETVFHNVDGEERVVSQESSETSPETVLDVPSVPQEITGDVLKISLITGGRLPASGIDHEFQRYSDTHFPESLKGFIPAVNSDYLWDADVLEALVIAYKLRERGIITGPPGTGKTTAVEQFAAWLRQPYMRLQGRGDLESSSFLGTIWATSQGMEWKDGALTQGLLGGFIVTIDEVFKIPSQIQMQMQNLYEKNGYLSLDDKPGDVSEKIVRPAPEFFLILTDNVRGTGDNMDAYPSTQIQDVSTLDRIGVNVYLDYLVEEDEVMMLKNRFPKVKQTLLRKLVKFGNLVRTAYKAGELAVTVSPRGLIAVLDMVTKTQLPLHIAANLSFANKIADATEKMAVEEMYKTSGLDQEMGNK